MIDAARCRSGSICPCFGAGVTALTVARCAGQVVNLRRRGLALARTSRRRAGRTKERALSQEVNGQVRVGLDAIERATWERTRPGDVGEAVDRLRSIERQYRRALAAVET